MSRDAPPAAAIRIVELHMYSRWQLNRRERSQRPHVARRIVVIQGSEDIIIDQVTDLADGTTEEEGMIDHNAEILSLRNLD